MRSKKDEAIIFLTNYIATKKTGGWRIFLKYHISMAIWLHSIVKPSGKEGCDWYRNIIQVRFRPWRVFYRPQRRSLSIVAHHHIAPRNSINTATVIHPSIAAPSMACVIPTAPLRLLLLVLASCSKVIPECPFEVAKTEAGTVTPTVLVVIVVANVVDGPLSASVRASLFKKMRV